MHALRGRDSWIINGGQRAASIHTYPNKYPQKKTETPISSEEEGGRVDGIEARRRASPSQYLSSVARKGVDRAVGCEEREQQHCQQRTRGARRGNLGQLTEASEGILVRERLELVRVRRGGVVAVARDERRNQAGDVRRGLREVGRAAASVYHHTWSRADPSGPGDPQ